MNPSPRKHWQGYIGDPTYNPGCGYMAMENHAIAFWMSRMTRDNERAEVPALTDIRALALSLRASNEDAPE